MSQSNIKGFTILEVIIALSIFGLFTLVVTELFLFSSRSKDIIFDQLAAEAEARRSIQGFIGEVRSANYSSIGSYPLQQASSTEIIFYSNIDHDSEIERVRYYLSTSTLYRGVTNPTSSPYRYVTSSEAITSIVLTVVNTSTPLFSYYDENYTGVSGSALTQPVDVTAVRLIEIQLLIDKNPTKSPVLFTINGQATLRSFKSN